MECRYAYMKQHIDYVLCNKEPEPDRHDREKLFHAVCAHQVDCPTKKCHKLSANWKRCAKLAEANQAAYEHVMSEVVQTPAEEPKKPTRRRKAAQSEE